MTVFITGASSGIGEACARAFAKAGYPLILAARRSDRLNALQDELQRLGERSIHTISLDVRDPQQIKMAIQENPEAFKSVDVVINNAGLAQGLEPIQAGDTADWDTMIDTNLKGLLYVTRALLPRMIEKHRGHIVNLGSVAGHWVYERGAVYCATKYAVRALSEGLRIDLAGTGIRVTEISPGMVKTEFSEVRFKGDRPRAESVYQGVEPLQAHDIAETVLWCVQRPAHVNIQELVIYPTDQPSVHSFHRKPSPRT